MSGEALRAEGGRAPFPSLRLALWICIAVVGIAVLAPCLTLVVESFSATGAGGRAFSLIHYRDIFTRHATAVLFFNTIAFSAAMTLLSGTMGFFFAWVAARTDAPGRRFMSIAILLPYTVPPMLGSISWILLLNPSNGLLNRLLAAIFDGYVVNIYSFGGMVFIESLYAFPLAFTFFHASFVSLNPSLDEASAASGASAWGTLLRITVPSVWPTILSVATLLFIIGLESFDVAWFIGYPAKIFTISTEVYLLVLNDFPPQFGAAAVYGVIVLILASALVASYRRVTQHQEKFASVTGKGYRTGNIDIGWVGTIASLAFYALIFLIGVLPIALLAAIAFNAVAWPFRFSGTVSLENFVWILSDSTSLRAIENTAYLAIGGAFLVVALSFVVTYLTTRTREAGRGVLDYLAFLPFGFPGTVLAVGLITILIRTPLYNTIWIMLVAYLLKFLPYGLRNVSASLLQIDRSLEEASEASGAGVLGTIRRILLPLTRPGILAAWSLLFIVFTRQFSLPLMLSSVDTSVVTIMLYQEWDGGNMGHVAAYGILLVACSGPLVILARHLLGGERSI